MPDLTKTVLLDGVAANMDLNSSAFANIETDLQQWAVEGLDFLASVAADYALESYIESSVDDAYPSGCLKIVSVYSSEGGNANYVPPQKLTAIKGLFANGTNSFGLGAQIWSIINGVITVFRTDGTPTVYYVPVATWGGTTNLPIPNGWEGPVIDYVTVKMKMRDEELQQADLLWQMFLQGLQRFRGFEDIKTNIGG